MASSKDVDAGESTADRLACTRMGRWEWEAETY